MKKSEILTFSALKKPIEHITLGVEHAQAMVVIGGMHGDEPEGAHFVEEFLQKAQQNAHLIKCQLHVIPHFNPDGLAACQRTNGAQPMGVDLNRNFPSNDWSQEHSAPRYYPGPAPESEPEVKALVTLLKKLKPLLVIHVHTYIPQINYTGEQSRPWADFLARDFGHPVTDNIGYPTPGSLGQFCHQVLDCACICIELPEKVELKTSWKMVGQRLLELSQSELRP